MTSVKGALGLASPGMFMPLPTPQTGHTVMADAATAPRTSATLTRRREWERRFREHLLLSDTVTVLSAVAVSAVIEVSGGAAASDAVLRGILLAVVWAVLLGMLRTRDAALFRKGAEEVRALAIATGMSFGIVAMAAVALGGQAAMRPTILAGLPIGLAGLLLGRIAWRGRLQALRRTGRFASRTLVVGNRVDVECAIRALLPAERSGFTVVGATLLDGNARDLLVGDARIPVFGNAITVGTVAAQLNTDTVVLATRPAGDPDFVKRLIWGLEGTAAELVLSNPLPDVAVGRLAFSSVEGLPLIRVRITQYDRRYRALKRIVDISAASLALIPMLLIAPVIALLVKLDSPGPVLFFQERVGRDGRTFRMIKFRSMRTDAERQLVALQDQNEGSGPLFKMKDDPRVTRVGRILRKLSLDELPQFWNVLAGDMSVVGPRPSLPREVIDYADHVFRRLYVKPGITGLWQVSGRSDLSWEESVRLDLRYVENWSVTDDLHIMWRTAKVMVQPHGAY
ncbi:sugar transferase [Microbacterium sp. MYb64]|uniref:sugar transferase n=1 Tax=Microbacterium sp. MYb64 TaxID=1848691 RepID=UPI000CFBECE6|nr:sugar transferase [Microbacterium sp. MYb64]PRB08905.1 polyprenyl glycosylphosphotransferase [Microbacterium sp. MYb64]